MGITKATSKHPLQLIERIGWVIVSILVLIASAAALGRYVLPYELDVQLVTLFYGSDFSTRQIPLYAEHGVITFLHVIPGTLFLLTGLVQFVPKFRVKRIQAHRWLGRIYIFCGITLLISGFVILFRFPFAGMNEKAPAFFFSSLFLISLYQAYAQIVKKNLIAHQEWVIRSFAIGLGISSSRVIYNGFKWLTDISDYENFGISLWLGWSMTLLIAEVWIRYRKVYRW